jgi:hypothetical protein
MKTIRSTLLLLALCPAFAACVPVYPYHVVSSHTIQIGDRQEADVVWVGDLRDGSLKRCFNSKEGPKCERVK